MQLIAKLVLRLERDVQMLHKETTFLFYFSCNEASGALPMLLQAADQWHAQMKEGQSSSTTMPLRQVLMQTLVNELLTRVQRLEKALPDSQLIMSARKTQILLPDGGIPFMQWNPTLRKLVLS